MFNLFRRRTPPVPPVLYFKDTQRAFEYACKYMPRRLRPTSSADHTKPEELIVGLVHREANHEGYGKTVGRCYEVSLAVEGGPIYVPRCGSILAETAGDLLGVKVAPPQAGDLVLVEVGTYDPAFPPDNSVNYFIVAFRLKPELETATGSFRSELLELACQKAAKPPVHG